jgi:hypothetical protein
MDRPTTTLRLALAFSFAVTLASAESPAGAPAPDARAAKPAPIVETSTIDDAATSTRPCMELQLEQEAELFTPASQDDVPNAIEINDSDVAPVGQTRRPMRGYCRCSCSFVPNCSTSADCGGGLCLKGPTCC